MLHVRNTGMHLELSVKVVSVDWIQFNMKWPVSISFLNATVEGKKGSWTQLGLGFFRDKVSRPSWSLVTLRGIVGNRVLHADVLGVHPFVSLQKGTAEERINWERYLNLAAEAQPFLMRDLKTRQLTRANTLPGSCSRK